MMEIKSSFAFDCKIHIDKMVAAWQEANQPGYEEYEALKCLI